MLPLTGIMGEQAGADMLGRHRRNQSGIAIGQRFRKPGAGLWEVTAIGRDGAGHLHARLRKVDDPLTEKTVAASVLADPRSYQPEPSGT